MSSTPALADHEPSASGSDEVHTPSQQRTPPLAPPQAILTGRQSIEDELDQLDEPVDLPDARTSPPPGGAFTLTQPTPSKPVPIPQSNLDPVALEDPVGARPSSATSVSSVTLPVEAEPACGPPARVWGVCLVGFDHAIGPNIEWASTAELLANSELNKQLPFLALPDGAHLREEDYSYFHLLMPSIAPSTIFGVSCNRQIHADELINKGKDVTRSTVQKAIVVLASKPIFGPLRDKLGVITRAYFAQKDFDDKSILYDLASSLVQQDNNTASASPRLDSASVDEEGRMYMGTSLRELVHKFRFRTLMLLKLLILQRKVMFYAATTPVEQLCTFQYSLVALVPALLTQLEDSASPELDERAKSATRPTSLRTSDKASLIRYLGLPLNVFGKGSFFQPYLPLQQLDLLKTHSFLVGTTNSIFQQQRDCPIDVLINLDTASVEVLDPKLVPLLTLTAADRKWIDEIVTIVDNSFNEKDPSRPIGMNFVGSEDFLRAKFEEYICSLLACVKFASFLKTANRSDVLLSSGDLDANMMQSFNEGFIKAFTRTPAFELWDKTTDEVIFDLVEPKHPMAGKTNPIEDVGIRLSHGLHDLHLEENLAPAREAISRGITTGSDSIFKTYSFLRSDLSKRQREFAERRQSLAQDGGAAVSSPGSEFAPPAVIGTTLLAGVDVASKGAQSLATGISGIGSFLNTGRKQLFANKTPPESRSASPGGGDSNATTSPRPGASPLPSPAQHTMSTTTIPGPASPGLSSFLRPLSTASFATTSITPPAVSQAAASAASTAGGFFTSLRKSFAEASPSPVVTPAASPGGGAPGLAGGWSSKLVEAREAKAKAKADGLLSEGGGGGGTGGAQAEAEEDEEAEVVIKPRDLDAEWEAQKKESDLKRDEERARRRKEREARNSLEEEAP